jgi:chromosome segregation ATPase
VEQRFSALSDLVSEPTRQVKARVLELEKQVKSLSSANSQLEKNLAELRRETKNRIAGVEKQVSAREKAAQSGINDLESRLTAELEKLRETTTALEQTLGEAGKLSPRINEAEKRIAAFSDRFANLEEKINAVQKQAQAGPDTAELEKTLNRKINENTAELRKQIKDLKQQIQSLEAIIRTLERVQSSGENTGSGAGEMIEQELQ